VLPSSTWTLHYVLTAHRIPSSILQASWGTAVAQMQLAGAQVHFKMGWAEPMKDSQDCMVELSLPGMRSM
jgi:hypothetical protein